MIMLLYAVRAFCSVIKVYTLIIQVFSDSTNKKYSFSLYLE